MHDRMLAELLVGWLSLQPGLRPAAHVGKAAVAKAACLTLRPDLLILGVDRQFAAMLDVALAYRSAMPDGGILLLTGPGKIRDLPDWLVGPRTATVPRTEPLAKLADVLDRLVGQPRNDDKEPPAERIENRRLSPREAEILSFIGSGHTSDEIGERLGLSVHTVRTHRKRLAAKLGTEGNDLVRMAVVMREMGHMQPLGQRRDGPDGRSQARRESNGKSPANPRR